MLKPRLQQVAIDSLGAGFVTWGITTVTTSFPPPLWGYVAIFLGVLVFLRVIFPGLFVRCIERQPIAQIDAREVQRRWVWALAVVLVAGLSIGSWKLNMLRPQLVSLTCKSEGLPVRNLPLSSGVALLDPYFSLGSINRWLIASAQGYPPDYSKAGKMIYRCELTNLSGVTLENVSLNATMLSTASYGSPDKGSVYCPGEETKASKNVSIPVEDLLPGRTFTFFHYNATKNCTHLRWRSVSTSRFRVRLRMDTETRELIGLAPGIF